MDLKIIDDAAEFRDRCGALLARDPLRHTVIATTVDNIVTGLDSPQVPPIFVAVRDGSEVTGIAMKAGCRDIYLGALSPDIIPAVVDLFAAVSPDSGGVEGPAEVSAAFAEQWCAVFGGDSRPAFPTTLYRLGELIAPTVPGSARQAGEGDLDLCLSWMTAMRAEIGWDSGPPVEAIRRRILAGSWWLWEDRGEPVSLVARQVPSFGWSRLGPVFTPPIARGNGYARALTAYVAQVIRGESVEVCLFADTDNAVTNRLYRGLGFLPVGEFTAYEFANQPA
ncbi:GNAT family N-acetyltransferase [Nocardia cyriacigeorgica]|uniref:GNAT family N-acetyltransferase n=1 Tax=Nocardia cyriacigeorgica TaxID=135487 RepID=UPI002453F715|nr:GNAT family N-acetyltransferase [Nocardia cyriacigeorgica]